MQAYHHGFVDILLCHLKSDQQDVLNIFNSKRVALSFTGRCGGEHSREPHQAGGVTLCADVTLRTDVTLRALLPDLLIVMNIVEALTALAFC